MLVSDFIQEVNDNLRALDDDVPASGTDEYNYWLRVANRIRRNLYRDTTKSWGSTYAVLSLGTVTASTTPSYNLSATYLTPANNVYVIDTAGNRHDYTIIKPEEQDASVQQVFVSGQNPQTLKFTQEIAASDTIVSGTLYLPGYFLPADFDSDEDTVVVDDTDWLAMATAAEIAFNDLTYEDKSADLNQKANALYKQMTANNRKGTYNNPRVTPTNVTRIPGTSR